MNPQENTAGTKQPEPRTCPNCTLDSAGRHERTCQFAHPLRVQPKRDKTPFKLPRRRNVPRPSPLPPIAPPPKPGE